MISLKAKLWAAGIAAVAVIGAVGYSSWQIHSLRTTVAEQKARLADLSAGIKVQNASIESLKKEAEVRKKASAAALKVATAYRQKVDSLAAKLATVTLPENECEALSIIVDAARTE